MPFSENHQLESCFLLFKKLQMVMKYHDVPVDTVDTVLYCYINFLKYFLKYLKNLPQNIKDKCLS